MPETTTPQLSESDVEAIAEQSKKYRQLAYRAATPADEEVVKWFAKTVAALIRDRRALQGRNESLEAQLAQAEDEAIDAQDRRSNADAEVEGVLRSLGNNAVRVREDGGPEDVYASLALSVAKLQSENTALREQLAEAELAQERLQTAVQLALQGLNERCSEVAALQWFQSEYCFAVEKVRNADESTIFELRKGLPTLTGKQLPTGVGP